MVIVFSYIFDGSGEFALISEHSRLQSTFNLLWPGFGRERLFLVEVVAGVSAGWAAASLVLRWHRDMTTKELHWLRLTLSILQDSSVGSLGVKAAGVFPFSFVPLGGSRS